MHAGFLHVLWHMPLPAGAAEGLQLQHTAPYHTAVLFAPTPAAPPAGTAAAHIDIEKHTSKHTSKIQKQMTATKILMTIF